MTKRDKLRSKLSAGNIGAKELNTLLQQEGWMIDRCRGSHQVWIKGAETFVLATHSKDLKLYQIKEAQKLLLRKGNADEEE